MTDRYGHAFLKALSIPSDAMPAVYDSITLRNVWQYHVDTAEAISKTILENETHEKIMAAVEEYSFHRAAATGIGRVMNTLADITN